MTSIINIGCIINYKCIVQRRLTLTSEMLDSCKERLHGRSITSPAWILVLYAIPVGMCTELGLNITFSLVSDPEQSWCWAPVPETKQSNTLTVALIQTCLYFLLYPLLGWLTDALIDRGKAIRTSVYLCWFGSLLQVVSYCVQYGMCGLPTSIAKYGISSIAFVCLMIGTATYQTDVLGYGLHQLFQPASFKSFIHWMVWGQYIGFLVSYIAFMQSTVYQAKLLLVTGFVVCLTCTVAVIIDQLFHHKFEHYDSFGNNSSAYKMLFGIMKYAREHKRQVKATGDYDTFPDLEKRLNSRTLPRRISLAKVKYGGPFREEEVESVKTFWRIVLVLTSVFGFYIPHYILANGALPFVNVFNHALTDANGFGSYILWSCFNNPVIFFIPLLEFVLIPLFPKIGSLLSNPMKGFGISYFFLILSLLTMLVIDTLGHYVTAESNFCLLTSTTPSVKLNLSYYYYCIPLFFGGLGNMFGLIFILEFIYAQAPNSMSGMLTGIFYLIRGVYMGIGHYLQVPFFYLNSKDFSWLSCSFWIILINFIVCIIGLIVYTVVCLWYKRQKRGDNFGGIESLIHTYHCDNNDCEDDDRTDI